MWIWTVFHFSDYGVNQDLAATVELRIGYFSRSQHAQKQRSGVGGDRGAIPFAIACSMHFVRFRNRSINGETSGSRCSFDHLYRGSDADLIVERRPEFHSEVPFVGFVVDGDRIRFVYGEDV